MPVGKVVFLTCPKCWFSIRKDASHAIERFNAHVEGHERKDQPEKRRGRTRKGGDKG